MSTNMRIFTEGMDGQILIVSGKGGLYLSREGIKLYPLNNTYELSGTMITVRIPYPAPVVNIYEYLSK